MYETLFNFNIKNEYICNINSKIILHIECINQSVSVLFFTDEMNNKIDIPNGIIVYTYDYQNIKNKVALTIEPNYYILSFSDNYDIEFNGKIILNITNQRNWNIKAT